MLPTNPIVCLHHANKNMKCGAEAKIAFQN